MPQNNTSLFKTVMNSLFVSLLLVGLLTSLTHSPAVYAEDELLEVDDAFKLQPPIVKDQNILISWKIAEDYHLYRDKMSITSDSTAVQTAIYSKAKLVDDALFGKTKTYEHAATASLPFENSSNAATTNTLTIIFHVCADKIGVCYPPQTRTFKIELPASQAANQPASPEASGGFGSLSALNSFFKQDSGQPELLEADQAFQFSHQINAAGQLELIWNIADDYHLYQDKFKVRVTNGAASLGAL